MYMLPKGLIMLLGLPFALLCCLLVPVLFLTVFVCSPLIYIYRCVTGPVQAGASTVSHIAHPPSA